MEAIPFLIIHFLAIAQLIAIPLIYFVAVAYVSWILARRRLFRINFVYLVVAVIGPAAWLVHGYTSFNASCNTGKGVQVHKSIMSVKGIYLKPFQHEGSFSVNTISPAPRELLKNLTYSCLEYDSSPSYVALITTTGQEHRARNAQNNHEPLCSDYAFEVTTPKPVSWLTEPYHKTSKTLITNRFTGEALAEVEEHLYGGGLVAGYRKYLGDWSNDNYLACGYVSKDPHKWRDTNSSLKIYLEADSKLITAVLLPSADNRVNGGNIP